MGRRCKLSGALLGLLLGCSPTPPATRDTPLPYTGKADLAGVDTTPLRGRRILIDPGHGGRFGGAQGAGATREADVNLGVALYLWGLLRDAGADAHLTRSSDRDLLVTSDAALRDDLAARVAAIDSLRPDVFLSLHHNSNAALDRERDAIETYYKLDDEGPSFDLGQAIHTRLVAALGTNEARLRPGNYFVLRGAASAAVLGEASYISNPKTESQLRLAEKQELEAKAYFLGLRDYFAHGAAALVPAGGTLDTLAANTALRFTSAEPIDPLSASIELDGDAVPVRVDPARNEIATSASLPPGPHAVRARARLARGNRARPWLGDVFVRVTPARGVFATEPDPVRTGTPARVRIAILDDQGRSVGDGLPVRLSATGAHLADADLRTVGGEAQAVLRDVRPGARITVESGGWRESAALRVDAAAAPGAWRRITDARTGAPLAGAWIGGAPQPSDRRGWIAAGAETLAVSRPGYAPWMGRADSTVALSPLYGGKLHGLVVAIDPGGDGGDPALADLGVAGADAASQVAAHLRAHLVAAGATPLVVRDPAMPASDLERVLRATRAGADWYLRIEGVAASAPRVLHYPGSADGERMARGLATWIGRRTGRKNVPVLTDTRFILQQTPCPAVWIDWPAAAARGPSASREAAYALFAGMRAVLDPPSAAYPAIAGTIAPAPSANALVSLDGVEIVGVRERGRFVFESVAPGRHTVRLHEVPLVAAELTVAGSDTTRVTLQRP